MNKILEEARAAVVKAVPETMAPSDVQKGTIIRHQEGWTTTALGPVDKHNGISHENGYGPASTFTIVGRPIRLADVLRTLQQACGTWDSVELWCNRESAELIFERGTYDGEGDERDLVKWNLALDSIDDQEQPVIAFIHKILVHE